MENPQSMPTTADYAFSKADRLERRVAALTEAVRLLLYLHLERNEEPNILTTSRDRTIQQALAALEE